jgi:arylsulfatase A-like enzyme
MLIRAFKPVVLLLAMLCLSATNSRAGDGPAASSERPNFVIILADDVSPDLYGAYGLPGAARTPNVDQLAAKGVLFKTAYATAMCAPTRAEVMTGRYANRTGVYHNELWLGDSRNRLFADNIAFSKPLQQAGYATAVAGKWHIGAIEPYEPTIGFDEYCLWSGKNAIEKLAGSPVFDGDWEDKQTPSRYWHPAYICNGELQDTQASDFGPEIEAEFLMDFISRSVAAGKPFLAYWPTVAPHGTRGGQTTTPHRGEVGEMGKADDPEERTARFKALNEYVDFVTGKVITRLDELGVADNTVVMFLSDNGTAVTAKTRGVERGSHVVAIMKGKGIRQIGATDELMDFSDIAPTLIDMAGAGSQLADGYQFDGRSLKPFLEGTTKQHRDWIYAYIAGSQLVRTRTHLLEAVNPILELPQGRFYATGENRFWRGYERVDGDPAHAAMRAKFDQFLTHYPPLTADSPMFHTEKGKAFINEYRSEKSRLKHLHNHKDYQFNDESEQEKPHADQ